MTDSQSPDLRYVRPFLDLLLADAVREAVDLATREVRFTYALYGITGDFINARARTILPPEFLACQSAYAALYVALREAVTDGYREWARNGCPEFIQVQLHEPAWLRRVVDARTEAVMQICGAGN